MWRFLVGATAHTHLRGVCPYTCFCGCKLNHAGVSSGRFELSAVFNLNPGAAVHTSDPFRLLRKAISCKYSQTEIQYVSKLLIEWHKVIGNVYGGASRCACALVYVCARVIGNSFRGFLGEIWLFACVVWAGWVMCFKQVSRAVMIVAVQWLVSR